MCIVAFVFVLGMTVGGGPAHAQPAQPPGNAPASAPDTFTPLRKIAAGVVGATAISLAVLAIEGSRADADQADAYALCKSPAIPCTQGVRANALIRSARHEALVANVALGAAVATGLSALVLWELGEPGGDSVRVTATLHLAPGEAGAVVVGRF